MAGLGSGRRGCGGRSAPLASGQWHPAHRQEPASGIQHAARGGKHGGAEETERVPLILSELEKEPDHWFWALEAITDENPVAESDAGDVEASARAWVRWGREKGLLAK